MMPLVTIAAEGATGASGIVTAVNTALSDTATQLTGAITTNAPIILGVVAAWVVLRFGIKFIKNLK